MQVQMQLDKFEKLGLFYLGAALADNSQAVVYKSADLTTHATIIGMTGSGKTGLGIGLIEEAAMDGIAVIAIDPKGDLANLKLQFPELRASDFAPWIDPNRAANAGQSVAEFARSEAKLWRDGLQKSQQQDRLQSLVRNSQVNLYTPGMSAGTPISVLGSLAAPTAQLAEDADLYAQRIEITATSILTLIGISADPLTDREHILLANIIKHCWDQGQAVQLLQLVQLIQAPPFAKIGVVNIEQFYPQKERFKLAMRINALLASPSFAPWLSGAPLDIDEFLYQDDKPCVAVMQISHLSDDERMFFMCLLLAEIINWMRKQQGTASLRAILYIDEMFGYMPPNANPPSKALLLTLLKQARAFGLGLVLSSQNPVDLDYKGLANCGTWFLGRMQTQQDRDRVLDGLQGSNIERSELNKTLAKLDKRQFLLHNVHAGELQLFSTRWCMSYLAGPISRQQALGLCATQTIASKAAVLPVKNNSAHSGQQPIAEAGIDCCYINPAAPPCVYSPELMFKANINYISKTYGVDCTLSICESVAFSADNIDFAAGLPLVAKLSNSALPEASYASAPAAALQLSSYKLWERELKRYLRLERSLTLYQSRNPKLLSEVGESRAAFSARVQHQRRELNDLQLEKLKQSYASKLQTLENKALRAEQAVERERDQAQNTGLNTVISVGTTLLSIFMGRRALSSRTISSASQAIRGAGRTKKEHGDIARANERLQDVQQQIAALDASFNAELNSFETDNNSALELEEIKVRARSNDIVIEQLALLWNGE